MVLHMPAVKDREENLSKWQAKILAAHLISRATKLWRISQLVLLKANQTIIRKTLAMLAVKSGSLRSSLQRKSANSGPMSTQVLQKN